MAILLQEKLKVVLMTYLSKPKVKKKTTKTTKKIPKKVRENALSNFQRLRRVEEANSDGYCRCISCGKIARWQDLQGGHYIPRAVRVTELDRDNVNPQCQQCNGFLNGNLTQYRYHLVRKIGEKRVQRLENLYLASKGDGEAYSLLSDDDKLLLNIKRSPKYYQEKNEEYKDKLVELTGKC